MELALASFHTERQIFVTLGVREDPISPPSSTLHGALRFENPEVWGAEQALHIHNRVKTYQGGQRTLAPFQSLQSPPADAHV